MNLFWDNDDKNIVKIKETPDLDSIKQNLINSKYSEGYSKIQKANDIEIKARFRELSEYRKQFVELVNEYMGIDEQIIDIKYEKSISGRPKNHDRESDILLKAKGKRYNYLYYLIEAQTSKDYFIFDRILMYYLMLIEDVAGSLFHKATSEDMVRYIYRKVGIPVFIVINTGSSRTYIKSKSMEPITVFNYSDYRSQYDPNYRKEYMDFRIVYINDSKLINVDDKYGELIEYAKILSQYDINTLIYKLRLSEEESNMLKEGLDLDKNWENFVNDCVDSKIVDAKEEGLEQGLEQGIEQTYLKMIFKGMDPRLIGCSEELFRELYEKAKQMSN